MTAQMALPSTGVNSVNFTAESVSTAGTPPGTYSVYAKISDGVHSRYLYAPQLLQIQAPSPIFLGITNVAGQVLVTIRQCPGPEDYAAILDGSPELAGRNHQ